MNFLVVHISSGEPEADYIGTIFKIRAKRNFIGNVAQEILHPVQVIEKHWDYEPDKEYEKKADQYPCEWWKVQYTM